MIESILLTAGKSSRMGQDKALLKIGEISVIERILRELIPVSESIIIVFGENYELLKDHLLSSFLQLDNVHFAVNKKAHLGMFSSIRTGFIFVSGKNPVLLQMIDQPFIQKETYEKLIESFDDKYHIFQPVVKIDGKMKIGHPILFSPDFIKKILAEPDEGNLRDLIRKFDHKRKLREVLDRAILQNINTPQDLEKIIKE
ncbi:MAG: nucleotidyltransferase family protein [Candidatus Cloacimonadales bacterium]|nr:nucleotidyltransferase family protein [Candidatus Cloacimonadales bacterium]